jgi:hypoxanthine phosphoribosyltransferase
MMMGMDFIRALKTPVEVELIRAQSYDGCESSDQVILSILPQADLSGKTILLIEDIVDTGRTVTAICDHLNTLSPAQIRIVTLLDKPSRRKVPCSPDWVGFTIEDVFVVGYGMDYNESYRDLPDIYTMELSSNH